MVCASDAQGAAGRPPQPSGVSWPPTHPPVLKDLVVEPISESKPVRLVRPVAAALIAAAALSGCAGNAPVPTTPASPAESAPTTVPTTVPTTAPTTRPTTAAPATAGTRHCNAAALN